MLAFSDLLLLKRNLSNLREVPYFNPRIYTYIDDLLIALNYCIDEFNSLDKIIISKVSETVWSSYNHIADSNSKDVPYEMEYLLQNALSKFTTKEAVIITAFTNSNLSFYFLNINVINDLKALLPDLNFSNSDVYIIQIAIPEFYSNNAIYMIPMYHELGHFIDIEYGISMQMLFLSQSDETIITYLNLPKEFYNLDNISQSYILNKHFGEYFCDSFAARFVGITIVEFLEEIGASDNDTNTHPATYKRRQHVENYISNFSTPLTRCMDVAIVDRGLSPIPVNFSEPLVLNSLNSTETYRIEDSMEVHGILPAYWKYLKDIYLQGDLTSYAQIYRITNDLVMKSIRNYSIREKWDGSNFNRR